MSIFNNAGDFNPFTGAPVETVADKRELAKQTRTSAAKLTDEIAMIRLAANLAIILPNVDDETKELAKGRLVEANLVEMIVKSALSAANAIEAEADAEEAENAAIEKAKG